jgi:LmbE family N-acetylglucosaminyl deacetylase
VTDGSSVPIPPVPSPLPGGGPSPTGAAVVTRDLPTPTSALAIGAHPDDVEFNCGGTLAKWATDGCTINHLILTDGSKGTWDVHADIDALVARREVEQLEAARRLGSRGKVVMLGHVDGELQATLHVRDQVAYWIRVLRPQVVLGHDPWKRYRLHPDHREAGWLTLDAVVAARDPHFARHHDVVHHRPGAVLLFEADQPDHAEDVTGSLETKVHALMAHESQFVTTHDIGPDDDGAAADAFAGRIAAQAAAAGRDAGLEAGELFKAITHL